MAREAAPMADALTRTRYLRLPNGILPVGGLAGTDIAHPHIPDGHTGTSCLACYGWCTDPRHLSRPPLAGVVVAHG